MKPKENQITAIEAAENTQKALEESVNVHIDDMAIKINNMIFDHSQRGLRYLRVMDALDFRKPTSVQWDALASHYRQLGFDWEHVHGDSMITW